MTKDEAIKIIQTEMECVKRPDCDRLACAYCDLAMREEDVLTAYQMALTALQTDGDCISRQAAIDEIEYELEMINSALDSTTLDFNTRERLRQRKGEAREILNSIQQLPSAQPEQPEIVRCKDCKYLLPKGSFCSKDMCCLRGMAHYHNVDIHNDFCSWGEVEDE